MLFGKKNRFFLLNLVNILHFNNILHEKLKLYLKGLGAKGDIHFCHLEKIDKTYHGCGNSLTVMSFFMSL